MLRFFCVLAALVWDIHISSPLTTWGKQFISIFLISVHVYCTLFARCEGRWALLVATVHKVCVVCAFPWYSSRLRCAQHPEIISQTTNHQSPISSQFPVRLLKLSLPLRPFLMNRHRCLTFPSLHQPKIVLHIKIETACTPQLAGERTAVSSKNADRWPCIRETFFRTAKI